MPTGGRSGALGRGGGVSHGHVTPCADTAGGMPIKSASTTKARARPRGVAVFVVAGVNGWPIQACSVRTAAR